MKNQKASKKQNSNHGAALAFEQQLWAAAEQAVPAPHCKTREYNGARPEGLCLGLSFLKSNYTTWKLARMNLAIRGIDANLGPRNADSFRADLHPDLKADFVVRKASPTRRST